MTSPPPITIAFTIIKLSREHGLDSLALLEVVVYGVNLVVVIVTVVIAVFVVPIVFVPKLVVAPETVEDVVVTPETIEAVIVTPEIVVPVPAAVDAEFADVVVVAVVTVIPTGKIGEAVDDKPVIVAVPAVGAAAKAVVVVAIVVVASETVKVQNVELNSASDSGLQYRVPVPMP